jgi:hypothetical protein
MRMKPAFLRFHFLRRRPPFQAFKKHLSIP